MLVEPVEGETICTSIAIAIRDLTPQYKQARDAYREAVEEYLAAVAAAIANYEDPMSNAFVRLTATLEAIAFANWEFVAVQMGYLTAMWDVNDCWNEPAWTPTGGSVIVNLGGVNVTCHVEWVSLEESVDGGVTWNVIWQGYATICE
jgi:hypothetical protein